MPLKTLPITLECAGNKRALLEPKARGEQFELGAISHAVWSGVPLRHVLSLAGVRRGALEVIFEGMDAGSRPDLPGVFPFSRSLPLQKAFHEDTILATHMNGDPLPFKHGFPLRLVVPGWYGMASVKWLHRIVVSNHLFQGPFQTRDYVILTHPDSYEHASRVSQIHVNSTIAYPPDGQILGRGTHQICGVAWAGPRRIQSIEISVNQGLTWHTANWVDNALKYAWQRWTFHWNVDEPGEYTIMVRATDELGHEQPNQAMWNVKGYMNNSIHKICVYVE